VHSLRLIKKFEWIEMLCPLPTKPTLYAGHQEMMKEQWTMQHKQKLCAEYLEHRFFDWMDATGHYHETKTSFWIGLWDPELLRICEDIDLDDHP